MGYSSVAEEVRKAFASVARLEAALARDPESAALRINLAARLKLAHQLQDQLTRLCETQHIELCNYRLMQMGTKSYGIADISRSLLEYQNVFSQIYDCLKNGKKMRTIIGYETMSESTLELAYTYSGSLGVVLLAPSKRTLFDGMFDASIDTMFEVIDIKSRDDVRKVAGDFGEAVVKRVHDWTKGNVIGGFSVDMRWNRSDGRQLGEVVELKRLERISNIIESTSDDHTKDLRVEGMLVGINLKSRTFHFVVPDGPDYRGRLSERFPRDREITVGRLYKAIIAETERIQYAADRPERSHVLESLAIEPST